MNATRHTLWSTGNRFPEQAQQAFRHFFQADSHEAAGAERSGWTPRVDVRETDKQFVILADIPGVDPATIEVSMDKGVLAIKGEREAAAEDDQSGRFSRIERARGKFRRSFSLPDTVDADGIVASGKHGVLEIVIPKKEREAPRRITINTSH